MKILIIGANSAIATATARRYAERHCELFLIARDEERLSSLVDDLRVRGASKINFLVQDLDKVNSHSEVIESVFDEFEHIDVALICHGTLPDQEACEESYKQAQKAITTNGLSVLSLLTELSRQMKGQGSGTIAVITSVAGDRGRQPNFVYGSAKAMVSTYIQGMRGKLLEHNIHLVDVRPGLVDSPMTAHMEKGLLWSTPDVVAEKIVHSIDRRKHTVYAPGYWRLIMTVVKAFPEFLFKRLKF